MSATFVEKSAALSQEEGERLAAAVNRLQQWLAVRDMYEPTIEALSSAIDLEQVDVVVLYGDSVLAGVDSFVSAIREGIGKTTLVAGGRSYATDGLIAAINAEHPGLVPEDATAADAICAYMDNRRDPMPTVVDNEGSNVGALVRGTMATLKGMGVDPDTLVVIADPLFMRRIEATFAVVDETLSVTSLPAYDTKVNFVEGMGLVFEQPTPHGMWPMETYLDLMSGEVPRLRDDEHGYGPKGKGFIDHVRIPPEVAEAAEVLEAFLGGHREADPLYA